MGRQQRVRADVGAGCPVCRTSPSFYWGDGTDRLFGLVPGRFNLYRCPSCRCIFQSPIPNGADIPGFYPGGYWWAEGAGTGASKFVSRLERAYREYVAADHVRFLSRCARANKAGERSVLDVGCGSGLFLHLAARRGFVTHGMDASMRAVHLVREQYGLEVRQGEIGADIWDGRCFDFVTMFHVLEHLIEPKAAIEYAGSLLKPGGSLIVQVPNVDSLQARCFRSSWYGLDVPRHIINFTPAALRLLLGESGFVIARTARFSLRDNPPSIASSVAPALDPIGRNGRGTADGPFTRAALRLAYFALVMSCTVPALIESAAGFGGTIWVQARKSFG